MNPSNDIKLLNNIKMRIAAVLFLFLAGVATLVAQTPPDNRIIDEIVAIVGDNYILKSDIDKEFALLEEQAGTEDIVFTEEDRYTILNSLIAKKILLYQAQLDSITISEERVNSEIDRRMMYILSQFPGGEDDFEKYVGKSIDEFKAQTKAQMYQQMMVQEMQQTILKDIKITPTEVRNYYNSIPKDSLPLIDAEVTVAQLLRKPKVTEDEKLYAYKKLEQIRKDIMEGADFAITAQLESDDRGSATRGGELGFVGRGQLLPEFEAMAFKLKPDTVSRIIETLYGYHILKLIERRGERVNVRHILKKPRTVASDLVLARYTLDTIMENVRAGKITFELAAKLYSDDEQTAPNGGRITDQMGNARVPLSELPKDVFEAVGQMKKGDYFGPKYITFPDETEGYKVYYLIDETEPHIANLEQDWLRIQNAALEKKKADALDEWVRTHKKQFYIKINDRYASHPVLQHWVIKH
ncbi:MAG TPA: peptidylprolyl isomerase [Bacteroidia bacterium]|nr:peptidylprolyl isomerase [Bacteroidia bacterium]